jgi:hypothetical protein
VRVRCDGVPGTPTTCVQVANDRPQPSERVRPVATLDLGASLVGKLELGEQSSEIAIQQSLERVTLDLAKRQVFRLSAQPGGEGADVTFLLRRLHGAADFQRYTRCPSLRNDRTLRPCFRRVREMKPRTVWDCHPVALHAAMTGRDRCAEKKAVLSLGVNQPVIREYLAC